MQEERCGGRKNKWAKLIKITQWPCKVQLTVLFGLLVIVQCFFELQPPGFLISFVTAGANKSEDSQQQTAQDPWKVHFVGNLAKIKNRLRRSAYFVSTQYSE